VAAVHVEVGFATPQFVLKVLAPVKRIVNCKNVPVWYLEEIVPPP
jgi:hypothetical protein